jgi:hypothetical protein
MDFGERELNKNLATVDRVNHENPYANTILLDVYRWSDYPEVKRVCEDLMGEFVRKGHSKRQLNEKFRRHLRVIILNLYHGYLIAPSLYIAYARDKNVYTTRRYKKIHISYRPLIRVIDGLFDLGLIEQKKGFHDPSTEIGFQSVIRATTKLIDRIESSAVAPFMIGRSSVEPELIVLRDSQGIEIDYEHQDSVEQMRENLRAYNALILAACRNPTKIDG